MDDDFGRDYSPPDHAPMRRRSYAVVRWTLITVAIVAAELTLRDHRGWAAWLRYATFGGVVLLVRGLVPRPDWSGGVPDPEGEAAPPGPRVESDARTG
jgi:hypothetical protein